MIALQKIYILWGRWNFLFSLIFVLEWHARKTNKQMLWFPQWLLLETEMNVMLFQQKNYFLMKRKLTKRSVIFVENSLEQFLHYCDQTLRRWHFWILEWTFLAGPILFIVYAIYIKNTVTHKLKCVLNFNLMEAVSKWSSSYFVFLRAQVTIIP